MFGSERGKEWKQRKRERQRERGGGREEEWRERHTHRLGERKIRNIDGEEEH